MMNFEMQKSSFTLPASSTGAAGNMNEITSVFQQTTRCPICLVKYNNPRRLHCDHSFCKNCLQAEVNRQQQNSGHLSCVVCQEPIILPKNSVDNLDGVLIIHDLPKFYQKTPQPKVKCSKCNGEYCSSCINLVCHRCDKYISTEFCTDCYEGFCSRCAEDHDRTTGDHILVDMDQAHEIIKESSEGELAGGDTTEDEGHEERGAQVMDNSAMNSVTEVDREKQRDAIEEDSSDDSDESQLDFVYEVSGENTGAIKNLSSEIVGKKLNAEEATGNSSNSGIVLITSHNKVHTELPDELEEDVSDFESELSKDSDDSDFQFEFKINDSSNEEDDKEINSLAIGQSGGVAMDLEFDRFEESIHPTTHHSQNELQQDDEPVHWGDGPVVEEQVAAVSARQKTHHEIQDPLMKNHNSLATVESSPSPTPPPITVNVDQQQMVAQPPVEVVRSKKVQIADPEVSDLPRNHHDTSSSPAGEPAAIVHHYDDLQELVNATVDVDESRWMAEQLTPSTPRNDKRRRVARIRPDRTHEPRLPETYYEIKSLKWCSRITIGFVVILTICTVAFAALALTTYILMSQDASVHVFENYSVLIDMPQPFWTRSLSIDTSGAYHSSYYYQTQVYLIDCNDLVEEDVRYAVHTSGSQEQSSSVIIKVPTAPNDRYTYLAPNSKMTFSVLIWTDYTHSRCTSEFNIYNDYDEFIGNQGLEAIYTTCIDIKKPSDDTPTTFTYTVEEANFYFATLSVPSEGSYSINVTVEGQNYSDTVGNKTSSMCTITSTENSVTNDCQLNVLSSNIAWDFSSYCMVAETIPLTTSTAPSFVRFSISYSPNIFRNFVYLAIVAPLLIYFVMCLMVWLCFKGCNFMYVKCRNLYFKHEYQVTVI